MGIDFEDDESDYGSEIAIWDLDRDVKLSSGRRCKVAAASDNVVLTAEMNDSNDGVAHGDGKNEGKRSDDSVEIGVDYALHKFAASESSTCRLKWWWRTTCGEGRYCFQIYIPKIEVDSNA
ncbi:hypothetical protein LXL04_024911 [Taraxacum kok-saghyz]